MAKANPPIDPFPPLPPPPEPEPAPVVTVDEEPWDALEELEAEVRQCRAHLADAVGRYNAALEAAKESAT